MTDLSDFISMITDHGLSFVISAIVVYGAFRIMNIYIGNIEKSIAESKADKEKDKNEHKELIEVRRTADKLIQTCLDRLMLRTGADRAFIFEFHNGGTNIAGLPFLRMTNTYEVVSAGTPTRILSFGQLPASIIHTAAGDLLQNVITAIDVKNPDLDNNILAVDFMKTTGLECTVLARITNVTGTIVGFCGIDFRTADELRDIEQLEVIIGTAAIELGGLLSVD